MAPYKTAERKPAQHRKRVITPARKEQNRIAQRLWRQRQKALRQSRRPAQPEKPIALRPRLADEQGQRGDQGSERVVPVDGSTRTDSHASPDVALSPPLSSFPESSEDRQATVTYNSSPLEPEKDPFPSSSEASQVFATTVSLGDYTPSYGTLVSVQEDTADAWDNLIHDSYSSYTALQRHTLDWPTPSDSNSSSTSIEVLQPLQADTQLCNSAEAEEDEILPDPWLNTIQFNTTTLFTAFITIATSLGLHLPDILGAQCLCPTTRSPFYRRASPQDDPQLLLAAAHRPSAPANMQPTLPQILIPHHPFLDLIPFPALRARAITMSAAMPHVFNVAELKADIYGRGALSYWTAGRGGGVGGGQPWDMRSWEAAPWFLRKWKLLLDGEKGALWTMSAWWREVRREQALADL